MSTKSTIAWGEDFHLYREIFDEDHVYLQLDTTHFEAGYGRVMIPIPLHFWETVRHLGGARLDLVDLLDEDLLAKVQKDVDERIAEYQKAALERPGRAACSPSSAASLTEPPTSHAMSRSSAAWSTSGTEDSASGIYRRESVARSWCCRPFHRHTKLLASFGEPLPR